MKKLLFISLTCLIVATSLGQNKNNQKLEIPKKSNTIELTTTYKTQQRNCKNSITRRDRTRKNR